MKKILAVVVVMVLAAGLLAGCGCSSNNGELYYPPYEGYNGYDVPYSDVTPPAIVGVDEILPWFAIFAQEEEPMFGEMIMAQFRSGTIVAFLETLAHLEDLVSEEHFAPTHIRDQVLQLVGMSVANARRDNSALYAEYTEALEYAEGADLSAEAAQMLVYVRNNIEHAYNH